MNIQRFLNREGLTKRLNSMLFAKLPFHQYNSSPSFIMGVGGSAVAQWLSA